MKFITGATGFVGSELVGRLLLKHPESTFGLLVRADSQLAAEQRVKKLLSSTFGKDDAAQLMSRIQVICGDINFDNFGMGDREFAELAAGITEIFHTAAQTDLSQSLEEARKINVGGTQRVINLALKSNAPQAVLHHVSTAYVAGDTAGIVGPDEISLSRSFRNSYERSKAESEMLVRAHGEQILTRIYRPSVVVGDSYTGQASAFNVIYIPARFVMKGLLKVLPASPHTPFDIVPVDYVADAISRLSEQMHPTNSCFHLAAGVGRETSPREILLAIIKTFNEYGARRLKQLHVPPLITPEIIALAKSSLKQIEKIFSQRLEYLLRIFPFVPYMTRNPQFEMAYTARALNGFNAPLFPLYAEKLFRYCLDTNWGKIPWENPGRFPLWHERTASY